MKHARESIPIAALEPGSGFCYGGVEWIILDCLQDHALCIAADVIEARLFDESGKNNFASSSLRAYLNQTFFRKLIDAGADASAFFRVSIDLTSDDGLDDYGTSSTAIGLIPCDIYRYFRKRIPNASRPWWTSTPLTTAKNGDPTSVRTVCENGVLDFESANDRTQGVRPICVLDADVRVACEPCAIELHVCTLLDPAIASLLPFIAGGASYVH